MTEIIATVRRKTTTTPRNLRGVLSLDDFERQARRHLPRSIFGYVSGGVETDATLRANRSVFDGLSFTPRILRDVSTRSMATTLFDETHQLPFGIAPMGFSALVAYDGDVCLAKAAAAAGSFAICSAASLTPLERVARQGGTRWFQAYIPGDELRISALLDRITKAGFDHLVVTADTPVAGNRENNARNGFDAPFRVTPQLTWQGITHPRWTLGTLGREILARGMPHFENMEAVQGPPLFSKTLVRSTIGRDRLSWDSIRFIRKIWNGKLVIKGVLHPQDARIAQDLGCDGIIVSNHGGRQLDYTVATLDALPAIRREVPDMVVMFDSGIRRGTDVLKAIMLGADFVFVGRPFLYAAATHGAQGVTHAMRLLAEEVDRDMAFMGLTKPRDIRDHAPPVQG